MQLYETVYIVKPDLGSDELKSVQSKYEDLLKLGNATIEYKENWGLRNLAYKIKNNKKGFYYLLVFNAKPNAVSELERNFKIDENIIRYLTTKADHIPSEPTPIMKAKIEKENTENIIAESNPLEKDVLKNEK
tara:strand:- start:86 stop:484 length:399 start_codon:yes stop_codon:yes gene_type:complete